MSRQPSPKKEIDKSLKPTLIVLRCWAFGEQMRRAIYSIMTVAAALAVGPPVQAAVFQTDANVFARATGAIITGNKFSPKEKQGQGDLGANQGIVYADAVVKKTDAQGDRATDQENVLADIIDPTTGIVYFSGSSTSTGLSPNKVVEAYNSGSSFDYDFVLTTDYTFTLDYAYSETNNSYYDNYFQIINTSGGPPLFSLSPPDGTYDTPSAGSVTELLTPGSYEFGATSKLGDLSDVQGPASSAGAHQEVYAFTLTSAAPEPSTWMLIIAGVGGIGLMLRSVKSKLKPGLAKMSAA